ncbi:hypothetical protein HA44_14540 [Mixta gaviniae]|nr:hypothetical protein HA44_14540 [Mixta gaviniae]
MLFIEFCLAGKAVAYAFQRLSSRFGDRFSALLAVMFTFALPHRLTHARHAIIYRTVDLFIDGSVRSPAAGHYRLLKKLTRSKYGC